MYDDQAIKRIESGKSIVDGGYCSINRLRTYECPSWHGVAVVAACGT